MASASHANAPKGILKKTSSQTSSLPVVEPFRGSFATPTTYDEQDEETRMMATFPVIETLTDLPQDHGPQLTAAQPSQRDARLFKTEVTKLTRSEFSDLVEERNCEGKCGYVLCPQGKRNFRNKFKVWKGDIADTENLNKWCSDDCARRALNVQLQLGVLPTYGVAAAKPVELLGEQSENTQETGSKTRTLPLEPSMSNKPVDRDGQRAAGFQEDVVIIENKVTQAPVPPTSDHSSMLQGHLITEGHRTSFGTVSGLGNQSERDP